MNNVDVSIMMLAIHIREVEKKNEAKHNLKLSIKTNFQHKLNSSS